MNSLLDVLHKRPSRSPAVSEPAPAPGDPAPALDDLRLEAEQEQSLVGAVTDNATVEMPAPVRGATPGAQRWSDMASPPAPEPTLALPEIAPVAPAPAAAAPTAGSPRVRRLFLILVVVGLLVGATAWVGWQLQAPADEGFLAVPADAPAAPPDAAAAPPQAAAAGATPSPAVTPVVKKRKRAPAPVEAAPATDVAWYDQPALPADATAQPEAPAIVVTRGSTADPLYERLRDAYAALVAGDAARAEGLYREVAAADATNVDALLGLAALAARTGRVDEARDQFRQVLQLDPRNGTATAALAALPAAGSAGTTESQLKDMLREQPASAPLHFALGLRYVADGRWPDAQGAFFEAVRHDPTNADYAFNLAVSLDRLGKSAPAVAYYQRALALAAGSQQFDAQAAGARLAALQAAGG